MSFSCATFYVEGIRNRGGRGRALLFLCTIMIPPWRIVAIKESFMGHGEQGQVMNAFYQLVRSKHVNDKLFFNYIFETKKCNQKH